MKFFKTALGLISRKIVSKIPKHTYSILFIYEGIGMYYIQFTIQYILVDIKIEMCNQFSFQDETILD